MTDLVDRDGTPADLPLVTRAVVARASEVPVGSLRMVRVAGRRLVLVRTSTGFHALDNACPHEGYGLTQGGLDGEVLTCEWHNWKFDVSTGRCVLGEEDVAAHAVHVEGDDVVVAVAEPSGEERRRRGFESLRRGFDLAYDGQLARDALRLMHAGVDPVDIVWDGIARAAARTEYGFDHPLAMSADCLAALRERSGDDRLVPVAQALSALAEETLRLPERPRPAPDASASASDAGRYRAAVEAERLDEADALLTGALRNGLARGDALRWSLLPVADHHLAFGHGAIYVQKAFEILDVVGWDRAADLLPHVTAMHVNSTREDKLPYMRGFVRVLDGGAVDAADGRTDPTWDGRDELVGALLGTDPADGLRAALAALDAGAGITGVLDAVSLAASTRMLRHDLRHERGAHVTGYGWLDVTHSLTYANAARWAWHQDPGPHTARLAMWTVFHVVDGGRHAGPTGGATTPAPGTAEGSLAEALRTGDHEAAVALALAGPEREVGAALVDASLDDRTGAPIVVAHHVKVARAAVAESSATGSALPLAAAARFLSAPARQRFVRAAVERARHVVTTGSPPPR